MQTTTWKHEKGARDHHTAHFFLKFVAWCADSLSSRRSDRPREYPAHRSQWGAMSPVWRFSIRPRPRKRMWSQKKRDCARSKTNKQWDEWFVSLLTRLVRWDEGKMKFWLLRWSGGLWFLRTSKTVLEKKKKSQGDNAIMCFDDELGSALMYGVDAK